jgi:endonuclease YncB( thermonuclease family)
MFIALTTLCLNLLPSSYADSQMIPGTVIKISDGDTVHFQPQSAQGGDSKRLKVRMDGMDTPELHLQDPNGDMQSQGYWGEEAAKMLASLVVIGQKGKLQAFGQDKYGRVLGKLINSKNIDLNLEMVKSGWGVMYFICAKGCNLTKLNEMKIPEYRSACNFAYAKGLGVFNPKKPIPELPFEFRARIQKKGFSRFVANMKTKKYYEPNDYKKVPVCDRLFFDSVEDAQKLGFSHI